MAKWARIVDGVVQETLSLNPMGRFPEEFIWVECPEDTTCHATYDPKTKTFTPFAAVAVEPQPELPEHRIGEGLPEGATIAPPANEVPTT